MSPVVRAGLLFGVASVVAAIAGAFIPIGGVNLLIAFVSVVALGWGAGYTAAKDSGALPGQGTGRGAGAGALAGVVNMILLAIILTVLFSVITRFIPGLDEQFQSALDEAAQANPDQATPNVSATAIFGVGGAVFGFCIGLVNLILMTIAGLVGGALYKGTPGTMEPSGVPYIPGSTQTYGTPQAGGANVYSTSPTGASVYGTPPPSNANVYGTPQTGNANVYDPSQPNMGGSTFGTPSPGSQDDDGGARIYPDNQQR